MFRVGMFSKINKVTTKTLRYYDEIDLLKPKYVDEVTGYRYYVKEQLPLLGKINTLKQMGFTLSQIKEVIDKPEVLKIFLEVKEKEILDNINQEHNKLLRIRSYLQNEGEDNKMYNVKIKSLPKVIVASMRQTIPNYQALFHLCPNIMAKEMQRLDCICAEPFYCFNIYHDGEYREENIDVEICEAVTQMKEDTEILKFKEIEEVPQAVCIMHQGGYDSLGNTYAYIFNWIEENGYEVVGYPRESFIDGIWNKENEEDWLTEIQIPVRIKL